MIRSLVVFASLVSSSLAAASFAARSSAPLGIRILATEQAGGKPIPNAQVSWLASRVVSGVEQGLGHVLSEAALDDLMARTAQHLTTDSNGAAILDGAESAVVQVRAGELFARSRVRVTASQPVYFELERDFAVRVLVVDAHGLPASSVPIALEPSPETVSGSHMHLLLDYQTTDDRGLATFTHVQGGMVRTRSETLRARVDVPLEAELSVDIDPRVKSAEPAQLTLPETGSVVLSIDNPTDAHARLYIRGREFRTYGSRGTAAEVAFSNGEARFPYVGLGLQLNSTYEYATSKLPYRSSFVGPKSPGEIVRARADAGPGSIALRARILDEDGVPLANFELAFDLSVTCKALNGESMSSHRETPTTDAEGHFEIRIPKDLDVDCTHRCAVSVATPDTRRPSSENIPLARIDLPSKLEMPTLDLGDVRIVAPCSSKRFANATDAELESLLHTWFAGARYDPERTFDALLLEIVRRASDRWESFLSDELALSSKSPRLSSYHLAFVTALRRVQKKPDPIVVVSQAVLAAEFPDSPVAHVRLENRDADGTAVLLTMGGDYRSGRRERWRVDVRTLDGSPVASIEWAGSGMGGGLSTEEPLARGEFRDYALSISNYAVVPSPGVYEARFTYSDDSEIASATDLGNLILMSSDWTRFEVRSKRIAITKQEVAKIRALIDGVVVPDRIRMLCHTYDSSWVFDTEPTSVEERLCAFGWKSLYVLFDVLDDPQIAPRKRAWVLAQLFNLTGLNVPTRVVGNYVFEDLPGRSSGNLGSLFFTRLGTGTGPIDEVAQKQFADGWKLARAFVQFQVEE